MLNNYSKRLKRLSKDKEYCRMVWDERIEQALRNYEAFQNIFTDIVPIADSVNLETWELQSYGLNPNNMGSKDTLSLIISSCGFLGITLYFLYFKRTMQERYHHSFYAHALIFFIFIESIITGNIFADSSFFILIFARMALNTDRTKVKK